MSSISFIRYQKDSSTHFGLLEKETVREIKGNIFESYQPTGRHCHLSEIKLLVPCEPRQILAVGRNYKSHLKNRPSPSRPEIFFKPFSAMQHPEEPIIIPFGAQNVHFEGELVVVIGRETKNVSEPEAERTIFGFTCGNDISDRNWQRGPDKDLQWWRAKGADTFAPLGPVIVHGINHKNLLLQTRLNGKLVQEQTTGDLLFNCRSIISYVSRYLTLNPGDLIFTGTPGSTDKLTPGDVVEVEIEGIGILRNPVKSA